MWANYWMKFIADAPIDLSEVIKIFMDLETYSFVYNTPRYVKKFNLNYERRLSLSVILKIRNRIISANSSNLGINFLSQQKYLCFKMKLEIAFLITSAEPLYFLSVRIAIPSEVAEVGLLPSLTLLLLTSPTFTHIYFILAIIRPRWTLFTRTFTRGNFRTP